MKWKLDNKGWGFTTFIIYLAIFIVFIIVVTVLAINNADEIKPQQSESENEVDTGANANANATEEEQTEGMDYSAIEEDLENAAYQYQKEYLPNMNNGDVEYVTATKLEELELLDNLTNGDILCTGYAKITYDNGKNDVMAFINCGDYITEGYNEELDK